MPVYKDMNLEPIFKRREEIRLECNKLMEEYKALEYVLNQNKQLKEENERLKSLTDLERW